METKKCSKCGEVKELGDFYKKADSPDGFRSDCKVCVCEKARKWREENKERKAETNRRWYQENKERRKLYYKKYYQENKEKKYEAHRKWQRENAEKHSMYNKKWREKNKEKHSEAGRRWYQENKERKAETNRRWYQENKEKKNEASRRRQKERYHSDPLYRMILSYRGAVHRTFKAIKQNKNTKSLDLLGTTPEQFYDHIDKQLQPGMTWENYGDWHLDHIKPINLATNEQEAIELSHYTNFRPLWAEDNLSRPDDGSDLTSPWPRTS